MSSDRGNDGTIHTTVPSENPCLECKYRSQMGRVGKSSTFSASSRTTRLYSSSAISASSSVSPVVRCSTIASITSGWAVTRKVSVEYAYLEESATLRSNASLDRQTGNSRSYMSRTSSWDGCSASVHQSLAISRANSQCRRSSLRGSPAGYTEHEFDASSPHARTIVAKGKAAMRSSQSGRPYGRRRRGSLMRAPTPRRSTRTSFRNSCSGQPRS
jgi:hypothetical protein